MQFFKEVHGQSGDERGRRANDVFGTRGYDRGRQHRVGACKHPCGPQF
jgi:hypothetical protein